MISVQVNDFNVGAEYESLRRAAGDAGAIVTFSGLVREIYEQDESDAEKIETLYLEHYPGMTEKSLERIVGAAHDKWKLLATRVIHRVGELKAKDQIVFVGAASAHRQDAFDAACFIMDYLKSEAPFWKKQATSSSSNWVESRQSDADAIADWEQSQTSSST